MEIEFIRDYDLGIIKFKAGEIHECIKKEPDKLNKYIRYQVYYSFGKRKVLIDIPKECVSEL